MVCHINVTSNNIFVLFFMPYTIQRLLNVRMVFVVTGSYVYSKQPIFGVTQEWFRKLSFSRLECGVHDKLHISSADWWDVLLPPWHRHQIEGTKGF